MFKSFLLAMVLTVAASSSARAVTCAEGESQMSVEGVEGVFCVVGSPCIATFSTGSCPAAQDGLPYGSYCGVVASGVYGCKVHSSAPTEAPTPEATTEAPTPEPTTEVPITTVEPTPVVPIPLTPYTDCSTETIHVSVQGVKGSFCVDEPVCVQQISTGNCPAPQDGLQFGSFCDLLRTGVYGCRRYTADNVPTNVTYEAPLDCTNNPAGDIPVSIVSGGDFCTPEPVCSGTIFGNCPKIQDGLLQDSECMIIETGVYGCVFMAST
ncbi:Cysteine-rich protein [Phytophthora palmivora]|uniref:Cysteine-rich protein n=1 Tax=Phytophthora palmivora TaxID=4796 RepID=A0A2P4XGB2_9STRA|nr:Cysteine-rich protein [Phytophthora palmivora]